MDVSSPVSAEENQTLFTPLINTRAWCVDREVEYYHSRNDLDSVCPDQTFPRV